MAAVTTLMIIIGIIMLMMMMLLAATTVMIEMIMNCEGDGVEYGIEDGDDDDLWKLA